MGNEARDPPRGYLSVGFHVDPQGDTPVEEPLSLSLEADDVEVEYHEEADGAVVVIRFFDGERSARADLVADVEKFEEIVGEVKPDA